MAQKNINLGTGELTGDGESLRSAFTKIEDNFTDVYASAFSGDYNDLTNKPSIDVTQVAVDILPDGTRDLGSPSANWDDVYAQKVWINNSFAIQDVEVGGAGLKLSILEDDGTTATIVADVEGYATQQYVTDAVQALDDDLRVGTPGALDSLNELAQAINNDPNFYQTVTSALAGKADTSSIPDLGSVSESIIPATDVTYDLGSATNRFRDIYLSGSTIDLGGLEISNVGGELQLPGYEKIRPVDAANAPPFVDFPETLNPDTHSGMELISTPTGAPRLTLPDGSYNGQTYFVTQNYQGGSDVEITVTNYYNKATEAIETVTVTGAAQFVWTGTWWTKIG